MPPGRPPKTPRNGGKFPADSRPGSTNGGDADWLAVHAVDREPVSLPKSLICRENTGNSPEIGFRVGPDCPVRPLWGSYAAYFPELRNREISADEQGISRREQRKLLVIAEKRFSAPTWTSDPESHHRLLVRASGDRSPSATLGRRQNLRTRSRPGIGPGRAAAQRSMRGLVLPISPPSATADGGNPCRDALRSTRSNS